MSGKHTTRPRHVLRGLSLAIALALALAACGAGDTTDEALDAEPDPGEPEADEQFPSRDIRVIVPTSAGGGIDTSGRLLQGAVEQELGVSLIFDNRPGGNYTIGTTMMAEEDGSCHSLMVLATPIFDLTHLTQPVTYSDEDFMPVFGITREPAVIRAGLDAPWDTFAEVVDDARDRPGEIRVAVAGQADQAYLAMAEIEQLAGVDFNIITYDGGAPARNALLSGEVDVIHTPLFASIGIHDDTKILAVDAEEPIFPELTGGADTVNAQLGIDSHTYDVSYSVWAQRECYDSYPERYERLVDAWEAGAQDSDYLATIEELGMTDMLEPTRGPAYQERRLAYVEGMMPMLEELDLLVE